MSISSLVPANEMPRNLAGSIPARVHLPQLLLVRFRRRVVEVGAQPPLLGAREAEPLLKYFMLIWEMTSQYFSVYTHQMKIFEISICLAFFTENLVKLHLKFVEQCAID